MVAPVVASGRDLRALAGIVSEDRTDLPADGGLPESLLADLMSQIRCDAVVFNGFDSGRQAHWFVQEVPSTLGSEDSDRAYWQHYRDSQFDSYPDRSDLRGVIKISDFYSARQWHSTAMYTDFDRLMGIKHCLMLCLPEAPPRTAGPGRHVRLTLDRRSGPDFSERDRAVLTLLRPHLHQAYLDAERRRHPFPASRPGNASCCAWWPPGTLIPRSPGAWAYRREPWAPTWKTSTKGFKSPAAPPPLPAPSRTGRQCQLRLDSRPTIETMQVSQLVTITPWRPKQLLVRRVQLRGKRLGNVRSRIAQSRYLMCH